MLASGELSVSVIRDDAALSALADDWGRLYRAAGSRPSSLSFPYVSTAWATMPRGEGQAMAVIAVRRGGELACVWPLYTRREGRIRIAAQLSCGALEYAGSLALADPEASALALREARRLADVLAIYAVEATSAAALALRNVRRPTYVNRLRSPVVTLQGFETFEDWLAGRSRNFRQQIRKDRRNLSAEGQLEAVKMVGPVEGRALAHWLFATKTAWLDARQIGESFARQEHFQRFFSELLATPVEGDAIGLALRLDGRIVAGCICLRSSGMLEYILPAFDPAFAAFSPGQLLLEDCARLAIAEGLDFDFRLTQNAYKLRWADRFIDYDSFIVACTWRGLGWPVGALQRRYVAEARAAGKRALLRLAALGERLTSGLRGSQALH